MDSRMGIRKLARTVVHLLSVGTYSFRTIISENLASFTVHYSCQGIIIRRKCRVSALGNMASDIPRGSQIHCIQSTRVLGLPLRQRQFIQPPCDLSLESRALETRGRRTPETQHVLGSRRAAYMHHIRHQGVYCPAHELTRNLGASSRSVQGYTT